LSSVRSLSADTLTQEETEIIDRLIMEIRSIVPRQEMLRGNSQSVANEILEQTNQLIDAWCGRRNTTALHYILHGWPIGQGLTDNWAGLLEALRSVRACAKHTLTEEEQDKIEHLIIAIDRLMHPSDFARIFPPDPEPDTP
jgi:hypothetical protein